MPHVSSVWAAKGTLQAFVLHCSLGPGGGSEDGVLEQGTGGCLRWLCVGELMPRGSCGIGGEGRGLGWVIRRRR